ncbi:hypothetical protein [Kitasatospora sp. McL0602]|uniref:hypothetical protein n=1 Tax=Kitasatospora sp. McL0602 TaxID=3439530 RepID=UPI003F8AED54
MSTLWPGVTSVDATARANGVRRRRHDPARPTQYHADDVRRLAPVVTAATEDPPGRPGLAAVLLVLAVLVGLAAALALWCWCQGPDGQYWH